MTCKFIEFGSRGPEGEMVEFFIVPLDVASNDLLLAMAGLADPGPIEARVIAVCPSEEKARRVVDALNRVESIN